MFAWEFYFFSSEVEQQGASSKDASGKDDKPLADEEEAEEQKEPVSSQASQPTPVTWESLGEQTKFFNFDILPKVNMHAYSSFCCILFISLTVTTGKRFNGEST